MDNLAGGLLIGSLVLTPPIYGFLSYRNVLPSFPSLPVPPLTAPIHTIARPFRYLFLDFLFSPKTLRTPLRDPSSSSGFFKRASVGFSSTSHEVDILLIIPQRSKPEIQIESSTLQALAPGSQWINFVVKRNGSFSSASLLQPSGGKVCSGKYIPRNKSVGNNLITTQYGELTGYASLYRCF